MTGPGRIGMFGGAFDPPHVGHRIVAADVVEALGLDRLLIVPTARPPHRDTVLPAAARLSLTRKAFEGDPRFEVSEVEFERSGPSWTVETLERIREEHRGSRLFLVVGTDQYEGLGGWRMPERILELAELVVMRRAGREPTADDRFPFRPVDVTSVDLSSTEIRRRLAEGRSIRYMVPEAILDEVRRAWSERMRVERVTG